MKKQMVWFLAFMIIGGSFSAAGFAHAAEDDQAAVTAADEQFYTALNAMFTGDAEPMKNVWSHADDVTYMGPGGEFKKGWEAVGIKWEEQAAMKLGGKITPERNQVTVGQDLAVIDNLEVGENIDKDGNPEKVSIRATNTFRKEDGQWKMIKHHTDLLPYLAKSVAQPQPDAVQRGSA